MLRRAEPRAPEGALLALYDAHVGEVYGFLSRRCGDAALAEDLTEEVFTSTARRFRDLGEVPTSAWLHRVARSRLIDHWRREARKVGKLRLVGGAEVDRDVADPADAVVTGRRLLAALDQLPLSQRAVLVLRYLDTSRWVRLPRRWGGRSGRPSRCWPEQDATSSRATGSGTVSENRMRQLFASLDEAPVPPDPDFVDRLRITVEEIATSRPG